MEIIKNLHTLDDYLEAASEFGRNARQRIRQPGFFAASETKYQDVQSHSGAIDRILGIPVKEREKELREHAREIQPGGTVESWSRVLHEGVCTWVGLNPAQLQTPYSEIAELLSHFDLDKKRLIVDLGAGYGRMGVVSGALYKNVEFIGYEMALERVEIGNKAFERLGLGNSKLEQANIASDEFLLPDAEIYFIYDFGSLSDIKKLLAKIEKKADAKKKFTVVARGRGINSLIQETAPWLTIDVTEVGNSMLYSFV